MWGVRLHSYSVLVLLLFVSILASGCGERSHALEQTNEQAYVDPYANVERYTGQPAEWMSNFYTVERKLALTFNGLPDQQQLNLLLDQLDQLGMSATFFLSGMRVAEEPDLVAAIVKRGHEIGSRTLNDKDLTSETYGRIYKEFDLAQQLITQASGSAPRFYRTSSDPKGEHDLIRLAAAHSGLEAAVADQWILRDQDLDQDLANKEKIRLMIKRGTIISMDLNSNTRVGDILNVLDERIKEVGYTFETLSRVQSGELSRLPIEQIPGYEPVPAQNYRLWGQGEQQGKQLTLTFDDWGSDYTVTKILDVLAAYDIKGSFFLRANGVERNPNLARAIAEAGHDVANHTYSHPDITAVSKQELMEEIKAAHRVITEAIQQQPVMLFRPPAGRWDAASAQIAAESGYPDIAMFDVDPRDWDANNSAAQIIRKTQQDVDAGGRVVLLHLLDDTHTIEALPRLIESLQAQGYKFVRMSEMVK